MEVVSPQWSDLVLATDVPYGEQGVLLLQCLNVVPEGWDVFQCQAHYQFVKDGSLTGGVQTDYNRGYFVSFAEEWS